MNSCFYIKLPVALAKKNAKTMVTQYFLNFMSKKENQVLILTYVFV